MNIDDKINKECYGRFFVSQQLQLQLKTVNPQTL